MVNSSGNGSRKRPVKPPKFKSISDCYGEAMQDEVESSSTSTGSEGSPEWTDSDGDRKPAKKRKISSLQQQRQVTEAKTGNQPVFRTLAQLLEPGRNERIKSFPPTCSGSRRKAVSKAKRCNSKSRSVGPGKRKANGVTVQGSIGLVVDLVFEKENVDDGLSSSNHLLDAKIVTSASQVIPGSEDVCLNQETSENLLNLETSDGQPMLETTRDPYSLTIARLSTKHAAESKSIPSTYRSKLKWREIDTEGVDPLVLVNKNCKVFSVLENKWLPGLISEYDLRKRTHLIRYDESDQRWHFLNKERVALYISLDEKLSLFSCQGEECFLDEMGTKTEELLVFATSSESVDREFHHGDAVWAETPGYPMWPAFVMNEQHAGLCGLQMTGYSRSYPVHYFGSHDTSRIDRTRVVKFSRGLLDDYHLRCSRMAFSKGLEEVYRYLKEQKLPEQMAYLRKRVLCQEKQLKRRFDDEDDDCDERKHKVKKSLETIFKCPIKLGSLGVLSLGKIVKDSEYFHDQHYIWTDGYTSVRKFFSIRDPTKLVSYKMEIVRNPNARTIPLFRVTPDDWEQVEGPTAASCWKKIYSKVQKARNKLMPSFNGQVDKRKQSHRSGPAMFGLTHPRVSRLIQALPYARACSKFKGWAESTPSEELEGLLPAGFKHIEAEWKHLDHCSVCDTSEEYGGNYLLQCDKCRMLVHMHCYGVLGTPGDSWLCNLCDSGAPEHLPPCCLCPIKGGAMKLTTDGRWVHLACALWIPETSCVDLDRMEPIDGIHLIHKERWKLTCSICNVPYGACIQCAYHHCRVSYHPLCARAAGFCTKVLEGLRRKRNKITGLREEETSVQLLSYCKRHMHLGKSSCAKVTVGSLSGFDELPFAVSNSSGSARTEPYNAAVRRGRLEPEHYSSALAKRAFLENRPYIITGCLRYPADTFDSTVSSKPVALSTSQRFLQMRASLHQRLTFGKSAIHGWGLFAKQPHAAGDMVIEYAGEIIRPVVADVRERSCYNSLVGAGTYMFCIDNQRVIDATRSGSIAHLINHSCEPNCYSRIVNTGGRERIIIFAKKDIGGGEEVTYDYRFTSIGEQLPCHCGTATCRGIVNMTEEEDGSGRILVPASELTRWPSL